jgi:hypothetical protein
VDSVSGQVVTSSALDAEKSTSYSVVIRAVDGGSSALSSTTTVTVSVTDVNDNSPVFAQNQYLFSITETVAKTGTWSTAPSLVTFHTFFL